MVVIAVLIGIARAGLEGLVVVALHRGEGPSVSPRQITSSHTKQGIARTYYQDNNPGTISTEVSDADTK